MPLALKPMLAICLLCHTALCVAPQFPTDKQREKAVAKQQFSKNFHDLQTVSQEMLREHEAGQLTGAQLARHAKAINKAAKTLRTLMALGELAQEPEAVAKELNQAATFDQAIHRLAKRIYDFAHSPHHQNTKVFDTVEAAKVQKSLLTIIKLSNVIASQSKNYAKPTAAETGKAFLHPLP